VNLIHWTDVATAWHYLNSAPARRRIAARLAGRIRLPVGDVFKASSATTVPAWSWWAVPQVRRRAFAHITGDPARAFQEHFAAKYFPQPVARAASLLCGAGHNEREWLRHARIGRFEGYDISEGALATARRNAERAGLSCLTYAQADAHTMQLEAGAYDLVFVEFGLHHLARLDDVTAMIARALKPDGLLVAQEYVGDNYFQWPAAHTRLCNELLRTIPAARRRLCYDPSRTKTFCIQPSRLRMFLMDPTESVAAQAVIPAVKKWFEPVEIAYYPGTIVHRVLDGIAFNFTDDTEESRRIIDSLVDEERRLVVEDKAAEHYVWIVARAKR